MREREGCIVVLRNWMRAVDRGWRSLASLPCWKPTAALWVAHDHQTADAPYMSPNPIEHALLSVFFSKLTRSFLRGYSFLSLHIEPAVHMWFSFCFMTEFGKEQYSHFKNLCYNEYSGMLYKIDRLSKRWIMDKNSRSFLLQHGLLTQSLRFGALPSSALHTENHVEINLVTSGSGVHHIANQAVPCKEGDVCILSPHVSHMYASEDPAIGLNIRRLVVDPKVFWEGDIAADTHPRFCFGVFCEGSTAACATLNKKTREEAELLLDRIAQEAAKQSYDWKAAAGSCLTLLLITLSRYMNGAIRNFSPGSQRERELIQVALRIISEDFSSCALTLHSISSALFVSPPLLSRSFKRCTGKSFSDYLRETRMTHACRLLKETDMMTEQILAACGLRDLPSFYRSFHQHTGMTPHQYRNQHSKKNLSNAKGEKHMIILSEISENLQKGKAKIVKEMVQNAINEGMNPADILNEGLLSGMSIIGEKFKNNEVYVPEVLVAARAMNMGLSVLRPLLVSSGVDPIGKVCIGTVQGDLHDIGKNLVRMMLEGKGFEVIDLGTDVAPETFVKTAIDQDCKIICCSALLTTTMTAIADVVKAAEAAGIRDQVKIMAGGAPVTQQFCDQIGVDVYTVDAASAANAAYELCKQL